jgi:hypothetical protein
MVFGMQGVACDFRVRQGRDALDGRFLFLSRLAPHG